MRRRKVGRRLAGPLVAGALLVACGPDERATGGGQGATASRTYQVRGVLESLPDPESGAGDLRIRHEAIPDLVGASGEVEGMAAMTMPFPVADGVDLEGLAVGDVVRFDLRVDWESARPVAVTAVERLPADTELALD